MTAVRLTLCVGSVYDERYMFFRSRYKVPHTLERVITDLDRDLSSCKADVKTSSPERSCGSGLCVGTVYQCCVSVVVCSFC